MPVRETSFRAYQDVMTDGTSDTQENRVLECLKSRPYGSTANEIARELGIYPSTVTARINGLKEQGLVCNRGYTDSTGIWQYNKRKDPKTKKFGFLWFAVTGETQKELF